MQKIKVFLMSIVCFFVSSCSSNNLDFYANKKPVVDLRSFFQGDIEGWGAIFDYRGRQTRSFYVKIKGNWEGNQGVLEEWFEFDDGEKSERVWTLSFSDTDHFTGRAKDVVGESRGQQKGNAVNMEYVLRIPYNDSTLDLKMDDWMYLVTDDTIVNRTSMNKFGFKVGEIVLVMKKANK